MAFIHVAVRRFLWGLYRVFGLACLMLALHNSAITLQLQRSYAPQDEQLPYFAICLALFAGTLFLLPSTTPVWVKQVKCPGTATVAIAALVGLAMALIAGSTAILPILSDHPPGMAAQMITNLVGLFTASGVLAAGYLGLTAPRRRRRAVPLLEQTAAQRADARMLRKSRLQA